MILGFVFKKNSKDFRNSKVQKIVDIFSKKNNSKIDIYDNNLIHFPSFPNKKTNFVKRPKIIFMMQSLLLINTILFIRLV